jgi:hypothetical protein
VSELRAAIAAGSINPEMEREDAIRLRPGRTMMLDVTITREPERRLSLTLEPAPPRRAPYKPSESAPERAVVPAYEPRTPERATVYSPARRAAEAQLLEGAHMILEAANALARLSQPFAQTSGLHEAFRLIEQALAKLRSDTEAAERNPDP